MGSVSVEDEKKREVEEKRQSRWLETAADQGNKPSEAFNGQVELVSWRSARRGKEDQPSPFHPPPPAFPPSPSARLPFLFLAGDGHQQGCSRPGDNHTMQLSAKSLLSLGITTSSA